jgi:hypothetical protein
LKGAVSALQSHGFDRADLSFLAHDALLERRSDHVQRLANDPATPREVVVSDTDLRQGRVLGTGLATTIAAFAAAGITVATGGVVAAAIAATTAVAGVGAVSTLVGRKLANDEESFLDAQLARGGVLLWVRTPRPMLNDERLRCCDAFRRIYMSTNCRQKCGRCVPTTADSSAPLDVGLRWYKGQVVSEFQ